MVDHLSDWLDLNDSRTPASTGRTRVPVTVESVSEDGALEVSVTGSGLPPVVTSGEPGVWAVGASAVGLMDSGGHIVRVLAPGSLPDGALPVPVGTAAKKLQEHAERLAQIRGEWQADVDVAKELAESSTSKALATAREELAESQRQLEQRTASAQAAAQAAASKAEGARLEAVKAVSANGKLEAQVAELARNTGDAWNRAVAAAAGSPNVGGAWTDEWVCDREVTKSPGEFVLSGTPSGESNLVRVLSKTVELVPGRTYRADFTVVNAGRKTVSVDAGFYYENASGWVSSVWGKPRVEIRPGDSAVISNEVTVAYPEGATLVRAVFSGDKDTASQDVHITSGLLTDVTDLVDVQADFDRKITEVSGTAAGAGNAAASAQRAADAAKSAASAAQSAADGANSAAGRAQRTADSANSAAGRAQSAADGAKSAADAAARSATQAQATADGKNTVTRSTNTPGSTRGSRAGDVWWRFADSTLTGAIIGQWTWNGSTWKPALIDSAIIASLTVDKLAVTGGATFPVAVIDTLVGDDAFFKNVYSNRLLVAPGNVVADGWGENGGKFWPKSAGAWNGDYFVTNAGQGSFFLDLPATAAISPGRYRLEVEAKTDKPGMVFSVNVDLTSVALAGWTAGDGGHKAGNHAVADYAFTDTRYRKFVSEVNVTDEAAFVRRVWIRPNGSKGTVSDGKLWVRLRFKPMVGVVDIADGAVSADKITASKELWAKLATFVKVNTQMLVAGSAKITENLLADIIQLKTAIIAGNPEGTHTKLDPQGLHVYRRGRGGSEPIEAIRLGADDSEDYLGIAGPDGALVSSMDAAGGAAFQSLNVSGAASLGGLLLDGQDVGAILADRAQAVSFVSDKLNQPAFNSTKHAAGAKVWVDEHIVHNPHEAPMLALYVGASLSARVETQASGKESWGSITAKLLYRDSPVGQAQQPTQTSPTLTEQTMTNQGSGHSSAPVIVPMLIPPRTTRCLVLEVAGANTRFSIPAVPYAATVISFGASQGENDMPGRLVAWSTDMQYGSYSPPAQKQRHVKTYSPTWGATYEVANGARYDAYDGDGVVVHGQVPGKRYYAKGCIGFPNMTGDLAGATIEKVEAYVYFRHWWNGSGGTAGVGYHSSLNLPGTVNGGTRQQAVSTPRAAGRWVTLPASTHAALKNGQFRGILLMPSSQNLSEYGLCVWRETRLRVTYTK